MSKYLYGAAVQGIQDFIFKTNKLREIVGASELVERACTDAFDDYSENKGTIVVRAAGNIKHIFDNEDDCEKAVESFPKKVMEMAPGVTISQAVVKMEGKYADFKTAVDKLEKRLRAQRNKPSRSMTIGLMGISRARNTGLPLVEVEHKKNGEAEYFDIATSKKREASKDAQNKLVKKNFGESFNIGGLAFEINDLTESNNWIAVVHIDGNGLGQVIQKIGSKSDKLSEFSKSLNESTVAAAQVAYRYVSKDNDNKAPIRPIVLSGDDHTIICRADIALSYVAGFCRVFEKETKKRLGNLLTNKEVGFDHLTACAGIAYAKASFPFYYAYNLAEELCLAAKKDAKSDANMPNNKLPQSCVMFHKVQDSFVSSYADIVKRELTTKDGISLSYGPYYLHEIESRITITDICNNVQEILNEGSNGDAILADLRKWLTVLHNNPKEADQLISRLKQLNTSKEDIIEFITNTKSDNRKATPLYDILTLKTIKNQVTKTIAKNGSEQ